MRSDMTTGSEWKEILLFSLPIMMGQLLQQMYNTADSIVVGQFVSQGALAAVGACMPLVMLFMAVSMGLSGGTGIMIAQYYGARRYDELRTSTSTALILMTGLGLVFTFFGIFGAGFLVTDVLHIDIPEIRAMAITYFWIHSTGMAFHFVYNCVSSLLRSIGDSRATLYFLLISAVLNLFLDLLFVVPFGWGVAGAAAATAISHVACCVVSVIYMMKKYPMFRFKLRELHFSGEKVKTILRLGLPSVIQQALMSMGHVFIQRVVNSFGEHTMAAFTVGTRIDGFMFTTVFGLNMGVSTFTGQNIGAGKTDRVRRAWKRGILMAALMTTAVALTLYFFAGQVTQFFGVSEEAMQQSVQFVRYNCIFFPIFAINGVTLAVLQGAGDVMYTTSASIASFVIRVSTTYLLAYVLNIGYTSIWKSIPIGWGVSLIMGFIRYSSGVWKKKSIVTAREGLIEGGLPEEELAEAGSGE